MNISNKYPVMVFLNEYEGKKRYKIGLANKNKDGQYEYGTISARFKTEPEIENKGKINLTSAWLSFYKVEDKCVPYVYVNEYEIVSGKKTSALEVFGEDITIDESDLPF